MNTFKDTRNLLKSKLEASKIPSSRLKQSTPSAQKQNNLLDYIKKQKRSKNQTQIANKLKKDIVQLAESAQFVRKKSKLNDVLIGKGLNESAKIKEQFNMTMGSRKEDKKNLFITADVSSALKALKTQMKMDTMGNTGKQNNMMTEEDIDNLFEGTKPETQLYPNIQLEKIKKILESDPIPKDNTSKKKAQKIPGKKDYADSIKYLELEHKQEDKLLTALKDKDLVKVEAEKGIDKTAVFREQFVVGKQIGQGAYGSVRIAIYTSINKRIAIKVYEKKKIKDPQRKKSVRRQIKILQQIDHKNIVKIFDVYETNNHINLIMQYVPGICLSSYLKNQPDCKLAEKVAKKMFKEIVEGIVYLHNQNISHRDIKLDNILLDSDLSPKIIDFGFATCIDNSEKVKMFCGTPSFMAPQIVKKEEYRGPPVDVWALGVVLFVMLTGVFPFKGNTDKELYTKICNSQHPNIDNLSVQAQNLLKLMLNVDADDRITGEQILEHDWFKPYSRVVQSKNSFLNQSSKIDLQNYESKFLERQRINDSKEAKQRKGFNVTQSHLMLKQILRNAQISPRPLKNEYSNSKPSTPINEKTKRQTKTDYPAPVPFQRLTNKAYF